MATFDELVNLGILVRLFAPEVATPLDDALALSEQPKQGTRGQQAAGR